MRTRRSSPVIRCLALLGLCSWLVGCQHWVAIEEPYADAITEKEPGELRIRTVAGDEVKLRNAALVGDSIVGTERGESTSIPMAVALSSVASVDERKADAAATVGATFGGLLLIGTASSVIALAAWDGPFASCCQ